MPDPHAPPDLPARLLRGAIRSQIKQPSAVNRGEPAYTHEEVWFNQGVMAALVAFDNAWMGIDPDTVTDPHAPPDRPADDEDSGWLCDNCGQENPESESICDNCLEDRP